MQARNNVLAQEVRRADGIVVVGTLIPDAVDERQRCIARASVLKLQNNNIFLFIYYLFCLHNYVNTSQTYKKRRVFFLLLDRRRQSQRRGNCYC